MSRYRLLPTPAQEAVLRDHCAHARYVWNLAVEQHSHWRPGRKGAPGYLEQCRRCSPRPAQSTHGWPPAPRPCSSRRYATSPRRGPPSSTQSTRPGGRRGARPTGTRDLRIVGRRGQQWDVRRVSRKTGQVWVPKAGWVRFRWSRAVPPGVKSYRVTMDRAGRWHIAFAVIPAPVPAPGNGQVVGIDRGVAVSAALSTGQMLRCPALTARERPGCGDCSVRWPGPSGARTAAAGSGTRSPACGPGRPTGAKTGPRRPAPASRGGST